MMRSICLVIFLHLRHSNSMLICTPNMPNAYQRVGHNAIALLLTPCAHRILSTPYLE